MEGQGFRDRAPEFEAASAQVVGISFDTQEENKAFAEKFGFEFPLLSDLDHKVGEAYIAKRREGSQAINLPRRLTYLIDPLGRIAKAYKVTDIGSHPGEVLADIGSLKGMSPS